MVSHEHAPWSIQNGVFDTAREAEYTPALAKALATTILESLAGEYKLTNVSQVAKKLKLSHFQAIAARQTAHQIFGFSYSPGVCLHFGFSQSSTVSYFFCAA